MKYVGVDIGGTNLKAGLDSGVSGTGAGRSCRRAAG